MPQNPAVSIIVPVYDSGATLRTALESLREQNLQDLEVIMVNDGSPDPQDSTTMQEYSAKDERFRALYHKQNIGTSTARKTGVEAARADYIGFLDSDDYAHSECFSTLLDAATRHSADISCGNFQTFATESQIPEFLAREARQKPGKTITMTSGGFFRLQMSQIPSPYYLRVDWWNKLYRRHLFNSPLFSFSSASRNEGTTSLCLTLLSKQCAIVDRVLFYTRTSPKSMCRTYSLAKVRDIVTTAEHFRAFC